MDQVEGEAVTGATMTCRRCGTEVVEVFYGPCLACCEDLVAKYSPAGRNVAEGAEVVEAPERVHRTPNFVATRD